MYKIYHNPRCKTCRTGLQYLESKGVQIEVVKYLKDEPFTEEKLAEILKKIGKKPFEMVRTNEKLYKENYKGKEFTDEEWIKILVENPRLIQRPIIIKDNEKGVVGRKTETIDEIL